MQQMDPRRRSLIFQCAIAAIRIHPVLLDQKIQPSKVHIRDRAVRRDVRGPEGPGALVGVLVATLSYQAFKSGSVVASSNSCAMIEAIASAPRLPFGEVLWAEQALGHGRNRQ